MEVERLLEAVAADLEGRPPVRVERRAHGIEALHVNEDGDAARPRIFFFAEKDRVIAFFYKPSRLDFSRDRFAYGAMFLYDEVVDEILDDAVAFLVSGFHPESRPRRLKRSLPFTVPEI